MHKHLHEGKIFDKINKDKNNPPSKRIKSRKSNQNNKTLSKSTK